MASVLTTAAAAAAAAADVVAAKGVESYKSHMLCGTTALKQRLRIPSIGSNSRRSSSVGVKPYEQSPGWQGLWYSHVDDFQQQEGQQEGQQNWQQEERQQWQH
jgi:hypothetical protein